MLTFGNMKTPAAKGWQFTDANRNYSILQLFLAGTWQANCSKDTTRFSARAARRTPSDMSMIVAVLE
jgi:hypothetical protein